MSMNGRVIDVHDVLLDFMMIFSYRTPSNSYSRWFLMVRSATSAVSAHFPTILIFEAPHRTGSERLILGTP